MYICTGIMGILQVGLTRGVAAKQSPGREKARHQKHDCTFKQK